MRLFCSESLHPCSSHITLQFWSLYSYHRSTILQEMSADAPCFFAVALQSLPAHSAHVHMFVRLNVIKNSSPKTRILFSRCPSLHRPSARAVYISLRASYCLCVACCNASRLFAAMSFRTSATEGTEASVALKTLTPSDAAAVTGPALVATAATCYNL